MQECNCCGGVQCTEQLKHKTFVANNRRSTEFLFFIRYTQYSTVQYKKNSPAFPSGTAQLPRLEQLSFPVWNSSASTSGTAVTHKHLFLISHSYNIFQTSFGALTSQKMHTTTWTGMQPATLLLNIMQKFSAKRKMKALIMSLKAWATSNHIQIV